MAEQSVTLEPGESKVVTFEAIPDRAKTYQVSVDGLTGNFVAMAIPDIKLISLTWDATPPFDTGSRHVWTLTMQNLAVSRLTYQLEMYMNGKHFMGYTANLAAGEVRKISYPYTFGAEGSYTLTIKAYYEDKLLDEISKTVTVRVPEAPPFIDGTIWPFDYGLAWWEGLPSWEDLGYSNTWPADTDIVVAWRVKNTGNVTATFKLAFMGRSGSITLKPGAIEENGKKGIQFTVHTSGPGSYNYLRNLYGDGKLIDSTPIAITTY